MENKFRKLVGNVTLGDGGRALRTIHYSCRYFLEYCEKG